MPKTVPSIGHVCSTSFKLSMKKGMMAKIGPSKKQRMAAAANVRSPFLYWMLVVTSWPPFGQVTVTGVSLKTT